MNYEAHPQVGGGDERTVSSRINTDTGVSFTVLATAAILRLISVGGMHRRPSIPDLATPPKPPPKIPPFIP
jgi:hypothetical protein